MARSETVTVRIADLDEVTQAIRDAHEEGFQLALTMLRDRGYFFAAKGQGNRASLLIQAADALARGTHISAADVAGGDSEQ